ncbi:MAG: ADP-ribosylglycohydrolase family protein, partial [Psychrosphaera sp.]|nr:ADP-ribosylglycohydrolase family protein [Psychrosphaera sp.]
GLALGDALGAPYEGGFLERMVWTLICKTRRQDRGKTRWTDDTQMTMDVMASLIEFGKVDQDDLAQRFAQSYRWSRGYGPGAAKVLKRIRRGTPWQTASRSVYAEGSFGNGGAMRAPVIGLFFSNRSEQDIVKATQEVAVITHGHLQGVEGAVLIALTTVFAAKQMSNQDLFERLHAHAKLPEYISRLKIAASWLSNSKTVEAKIVAKELGNGIAAIESCVTAIYIALAFRQKTFDELMAFTIKVGGDVDTISAMAGAIWGAMHGVDALPSEKLDQLEQCERLRELAQKFCRSGSSEAPAIAPALL